MFAVDVLFLSYLQRQAVQMSGKFFYDNPDSMLGFPRLRLCNGFKVNAYTVLNQKYFQTNVAIS